jgi:hypothetical protein
VIAERTMGITIHESEALSCPGGVVNRTSQHMADGQGIE